MDEAVLSRLDTGVVVASFAVFFALYKLHRRLQPNKSPEGSIRLVTMLHAALVTVLSYYSCFVRGPWPISEPGLDSNAFNIGIQAVCLGYFLLDYAWCLIYGADGLMMHLHHWFSISYLLWGLGTRVSGAEIAGTIFGSELTNPMLQLRWMLKQSGKYETKLGLVNDVAFVVSFLSLRGIFGAYFLYHVLVHPRPRLVVKFGGVVLYLISCVFLGQIFGFVRRKLAGTRRSGGPAGDGAASVKREEKSVDNEESNERKRR